MRNFRRLVLASVALTYVFSSIPQAHANATTNTRPEIQEDLLKSDFYEAINGDYLADLEIPADSFATGGFFTLMDEVDDTLLADLEAMSNGDIPLTSLEMEEMVKFYDLASDTDRREREGTAAIQSYFDDLTATQNYAELNQVINQWYTLGLPHIVSVGVGTNFANAEERMINMNGPSLILPDKTSYSDLMAKMTLLPTYKEQANKVLGLYGFTTEDAARITDAAMTFDLKLVDSAMDAQAASDVSNMYNPVTYEEILQKSEFIDLEGLLATSFPAAEIDEVNLINPAFFNAMNDIITEENFAEVKDWLTLRLAMTYADYFQKELREAANQFQLLLTGQAEIASDDEFASQVTQIYYDMVLGDYYGQTYFGAESREEVEAMVEEIIGVYSERLAENDWLSQETIDEALIKLDNIALQIGYPESYDDIYQEFIVDPNLSLFETDLAFTQIAVEDMFATLDDAVDRDEWIAPAMIVNAFYNPQTNTIIFPAAILQAPFYDINQSESANLGGIGAVIAHEISHAFDPNGALFDEIGNMANWWTEADYEAFEAKSASFVDFWNEVDYKGSPVNGELTKTENIADLAGLSIVEEILQNRPDANYEDFYENYAKIWAVKYQPAIENVLLQVDPHAPSKLRTNINVQMFDSFLSTYQLTEADSMYLNPNERLEMW